MYLKLSDELREMSISGFGKFIVNIMRITIQPNHHFAIVYATE